MSLLSELNTLLETLDLPAETGVFTGVAPDTYVVVTPMADTFEAFADNLPQYETQEARLSLFSKGNYQQRKNQIVQALLVAGITVTDRRYVSYEDDTGYHHYAIDALKEYDLKEG